MAIVPPRLRISLSILLVLLCVHYLITALLVGTRTSKPSSSPTLIATVSDEHSAVVNDSPPLSTLSHEELCFREQPRECDFDYQWRPIPRQLLLPRRRNATTNQWELVPNQLVATPRKLNVLYVTRKGHYLESTVRHFYDELDVAVDHPGLHMFLWGFEHPGYDNAMSMTANIEQAFPDVEFDIIFTIGPHWSVESKTAVVISQIGDCHENNCLKEFPPYADAMSVRYAGIIMDMATPSLYRETIVQNVKNLGREQNQSNDSLALEIELAETRQLPLIYHNPLCTNQDVFYPAARMKDTEEWEDSRPYVAKLFGSVWSMYPLRNTISWAIKTGEINATEFKHPGYLVKYSGPIVESETLGEYLPDDPVVHHLKQGQHDYAAALRQTQICMFDSSLVKKAIRKYMESFMSGCVVAADVPIEMEDMFRDVMIPLTPDMTAKQIQDTLDVYLNDLPRLRWMAQEAFVRARRHWTCRNKVDRLLEAAGRVVAGEKGYWFPFGFSATCRDYQGGVKTPWC
ncbi:hypothetical protein HDU98_007522 [Podochytrium sp. JEL0797]|nr:hypothetical protein HDU98_007522 [Podochytrium sp. JEL0797]